METNVRLDVLIFANATFDGPDDDLPQVASECARLAGAFGLFEAKAAELPKPYTDISVELHTDLAAESVRARLETLAAPSVQKRDLLIYWAGHGQLDGNSLKLMCSDGDLALSELVDACAEVRRKAVALDSRDARWVSMVLDVCHGSEGLDAVGSVVQAQGDRLKLEAQSKQQDQPAKAEVSGLALFSAGQGKTYAGVLQSDVLRGLWTRHSSASVEASVLFGAADYSVRAAPLLPNPFFWHEQDGEAGGVVPSITLDAFEKDSPEFISHFMRSARGAELMQAGWNFCGRKKELSIIVDWLQGTTSQSDLMVVTGAPGAGKSTVLGVVLLACTKETRPFVSSLPYELIDHELLQRTEGLEIDAFVHLTSQSIDSAARDLASEKEHGGLDLKCDGSDLEEMFSELEERPGKTVVLFDALDEAQSPATIARSLITRLSRIGDVRVIVGTRASTTERFGSTSDRPEQDLITALGGDQAQALVLSHSLDDDKDAVEEYVKRRFDLWGSVSATRQEFVNELAAMIAALAQPFLFATLLCAEVDRTLSAYRDGMQPADFLELAGIDVNVEDVAESPHRSPDDIVAKTFRKRLADDSLVPEMMKPAVEALMVSLAYAQGRGFPADDSQDFGHLVWWTSAQALRPELANTLAESAADSSAGETNDSREREWGNAEEAARDAANYLTTAFAPFITRSSELYRDEAIDEEVSVLTYRISHEVYAEFLRDYKLT